MNEKYKESGDEKIVPFITQQLHGIPRIFLIEASPTQKRNFFFL